MNTVQNFFVNKRSKIKPAHKAMRRDIACEEAKTLDRGKIMMLWINQLNSQINYFFESFISCYQWKVKVNGAGGNDGINSF